MNSFHWFSAFLAFDPLMQYVFWPFITGSGFGVDITRVWVYLSEGSLRPDEFGFLFVIKMYCYYVTAIV